MSQITKVVAILVSGIASLALAFVAFVLFIIDPNDYKSEIYKVVKDKTDMDLAINDRIEWQLWPDIGLKLGKTSLTDSAAQQNLVNIQQASVSVQVMPLLSKQIAIDSVLLDGAQLNFVRYANGTTSWDRMLNKLKSQPEDKSEKIAFNIKLLNINNSALQFKDEQNKLEGQLDKLLVQATDIDLKKAFPIRLKFAYQQTDAQGKTLQADNDLNTSISLDQEAQRYTLKGLTARSHLQGTLLPAPMIIDLKSDIIADVKQQQHQLDNLKLAVDYQDPSLTAPAKLELAANINANLQQQLINIKALQLSSSYPQKGLKAPATAKIQGDITANLTAQLWQIPNLVLEASYPANNLAAPATIKLTANSEANLQQQLIKLTALKVAASYPDASRPSPITADINGAVTANLSSGAVDFSPLDLQAKLSDKSFKKEMPIHLVAPISANWKEGKIALNGFDLNALAINTKGQLLINLPALASTAAVKPPVTQGMSIAGNISTSPFNLRQLMQDLGMAAPVTKNANTLKTISVNSQISGNEQSVFLKGLKLKLDNTNLTGDVGVNDFKAPKINARLAIDSINVDDYLPPTDPKAKPSTGGLLPIELLKQQNLDVGLTIGALTVMNYPIKQFQVTAQANQGLVQVAKLAGGIYSGTFNLPTTIDVRGKEPVLTLQPNIQQIEIANLVQQFTKQDLFTGKANYQGKLQLTGNSVQAWLHSISGNSTLKFDNGVLKGVNMMKLVTSEMGKYQALLPYVTGKNADTLANKQNDTQIASFLGEAEIKNGLVQTKALNADLRKGKIEGSGNFNLATLEADYQFKLVLNKEFVGENVAKYPFPIRCKGNLNQPASLCSVDSRSVKEMAATALLESEKVQKATVEAEAQAKQKLNEALQKNNVKLGEESQKAVENLNQQLGDKVNQQLQKLFKRE